MFTRTRQRQDISLHETQPANC